MHYGTKQTQYREYPIAEVIGNKLDGTRVGINVGNIGGPKNDLTTAGTHGHRRLRKDLGTVREGTKGKESSALHASDLTRQKNVIKTSRSGTNHGRWSYIEGLFGLKGNVLREREVARVRDNTSDLEGVCRIGRVEQL